MGNIGGRFTRLKSLKRGPSVETWLCHDERAGRDVVVKSVPVSAMDATARERLVREASILRDLRNEFIPTILELGEDAKHLFLVLPYVPGTTLEERLQHGPLTPSETLRLGICLLSALKDIHAAGVLHRDVKPANVLVEGLPLSRATLLDFDLGLCWVHGGAEPRMAEGTPAGTARYLSPELAGIVDLPVDERSDLYSVGAVLFEALSGAPLVSGESLTEVLRGHMVSQPLRLEQAAPRALKDILQRLVEKDPRDRYHSAAGALADLTEVSDALGQGIREPALTVGAKDFRTALTEPSFIDRPAPLALLREGYLSAQGGQSALVLLEGPSGGGKSRLLEAFVEHTVGAGASVAPTVLRGQAVFAEAPRPFVLLDGVVTGLQSAVKRTPAFATELRARLGEQRAAACAALPALAAVLDANADADTDGEEEDGDTAAALGPEAFGEERTHEALASLLDALGTRERPAVVLFDDCQWADASTLKLLTRWQRRRKGSASGHVLIALTFRSEEVPSGHPLRALEEVGARHVALTPLEPQEIRRLAESMAGPLPAEVMQVLLELASGSPFMASALLRGLVECGALVRTAEGWRAVPTVLEEVRSSRRAAAFLVRRLELLPAKTLEVLSVGALLGKSFSTALAGRLSGQGASSAVAELEEARARHIVWRRSTDEAYVFVHDKLREALLERFTPDERRALHLEAARVLEETSPERSFEVAYHYDSGGQPERALPHALKAGEDARARHALDVAEQQYRIAERGAAVGADDATRLRVAEGLGEILLLRGRYAEAEPLFSSALGLARDDDTRASLQGKLGDLAFKRGDVEASIQALERGLRLLGRYVPRLGLAVLVACLWETFVQVLHTAFPSLFLARRPLETGRSELIAIRLHSRLAHAYWFARGRVPCAWTHLRGMNLAERYPPTPELAQAYSEHAPVMTMLPHTRRGIAYAQRSLEIRTAQGDIWGQGQSLHFYGVVLYAASRYHEVVQRCEEAIRLLARTGDQWEINTASWHVAFARYRLGDLAGAVEMAKRVYAQGQAIGDTQATGISLGVWAKASGGRVPEEALKAELARGAADVHTAAELLQAEGIRLLEANRPDAAAVALEQADALVRARKLKQEYVVPVVPWLATALRRAVEALGPYAAGGNLRAKLRRANATALRAVRLSRRYPNNLPHALREAGLCAALLGHERRARGLLDESLLTAERQGARYEVAQSLEARGKVGAAFGWSGAGADAQAAERLLAECRKGLEPVSAEATRAATLGLADRFEQLLDVGHEIAVTSDKAALFTLLRDSALGLLRAEDAQVLEWVPGGEPPTTLAESGIAVSRSLLAQAVEAGRPVVVAEGRGEGEAEASDSRVLADVRSILCAPIRVRGAPAACLYVAHRRVGGLFDEQAVRIGQFLATLAGAAMENVEAFSAAEKAVRVRDEFLAVASHELRTPLTPLRLHLTKLQSKSPAEPQEALATVTRSLGSMDRQVMRLTKLIENLLDVSRIQAGRLVLEPERVELAALVRDVAARLEPEAGASGTALQLRCEGPIYGIWDPMRIEQVVTNVVGNALKYGAGSPVEVTLESSGDVARLVVTDHGVGIPEEDLSRIFERYERAASSRHFGGLGLGLYIVREILQAHGGEVMAQSTLGQGTTFTVLLPLRPNGRRELGSAAVERARSH